MSDLIRTGSAFALLLVAACATLGQGTRTSTARSALTIVERARDASIDTARTVSIVVRDVDEPNHPLQEAVVVIAPVGTNLEAASTPHALTDRDGHVAFGRLSDGRYDVLVRRVGYHRFQFAIDRRAQCREILEVYIGVAPTCLVECPTTPARAVLTTCRRPA